MASVSLPSMASVSSLPAAGPSHSHFDTVPDMLLSTKPIHTRRTSRNPKLAPLPAFTFNPGAVESMEIEKQASSPGATKKDKDGADGFVRRGPPPLPAFSFNPGAAMQQDDSGSSSPTHPILEEMAQNQSRRTSKPPALPTFSFNPSGKEMQTTPSPTKSEFAPETPTSARPIGHRRRASEFTGATEAGQPLLTPPFSASPQKSGHGSPVTGHGPPRFSHQHRRSQAVSITEIETSDLIKTNAIAKHRAGSVPSSPVDLPSNDHFARASQSISGLYGRTPPVSPRRRASAGGPRPRVEFSETVDVIPRPLSMISSETEGSTSTIRGTHSLTGSITSLGSPATRSTPTPSVDDPTPTQRPKTADDASRNAQMSTAMDDAVASVLPKRPLSASDSTDLLASSGSPVNRKRFWFTSGGSAETSPKITPKQTPTQEERDPLTLLTDFAPIVPTTTAQSRPKTSPERRASLKKRKVRTFAGAIFSRKARSRGSQSRARRTSTPPLTRSLTKDETDAVFDEDNTVVIATCPSSVQEWSSRGPPLHTSFQASSSTSDYEDGADGRVTSPVIDLDAALEPLGGEEKFPQTGFAAARNRMHSSIGRGVTDAFGVMHRRAESAPQMPPVNRNTFGTHRLGSSTNLAEDVFDEEEEDDFLAEEKKPRTESDPTVGKGVPQPPLLPTSPNASRSVKGQIIARSRSPIGLAISTNVSDGIEIVDVEDDLSHETARSSDSTISAPVTSEPDVKQPASSPLAFAYPAPQMSYASSGEGRSAPNSAISSPDADHINFDNYPRFSRHIAEPSPELALRSSTEDVPSLCDSVSTGNPARFSSGAATRYSADLRSNSLSGPSTGTSSKPQQAWKRASLASLNRLIPGSSHGEKSRLRFEESAEHEREEKPKKKGNGISKLMSFWRSKEKDSK